MKAGNKVLGLALGQKSILVAEVVTKGGQRAVSHCAEFAFPEGLAMSQPEKLGQALRSFLRERHITTKDAVMGLPAKRLVTRRKEVPPASPALVASTLRVQAEGEFSAELDNLVMDFAGQPSQAEPTTVLLIATKKVEVDECEAVARAAGLRVLAITSTTAALGRATSKLPGGNGLVLFLGPAGAELVIQHGEDPAQLRHLNVTGGVESINALAGEIRRTMAAISQNGTPMTMALWRSGETDNPQSLLEQRLSMPVTTPEISNLVLPETPNTDGFAPAIALGLGALEPAGVPVDFLHSRMAPPKAPGISNQNKLAIAAGILVAGIAAWGYVDWSGKSTRLADLTGQLKNAKYAAQVKDAQTLVERRNFAEKWLPRSPINIDVLRDVTAVFAQYFPGPNTIWATSLGNSRDIYTWELDGKAMQYEYPSTIVAAMRDHPERFTNPKLQSIIYEPTPKLWSFRIAFLYIPTERTPAVIAEAGTFTTPAVATTRITNAVRGGAMGGADAGAMGGPMGGAMGGMGGAMGGMGGPMGGAMGGGMGAMGGGMGGMGGGMGGMGGGMGGMGGGMGGMGGGMGGMGGRGGGMGGGGRGGGGRGGGMGGGGMGGFGGGQGGFGGGQGGFGGGMGGAAGGGADGGGGAVDGGAIDGGAVDGGAIDGGGGDFGN